MVKLVKLFTLDCGKYAYARRSIHCTHMRSTKCNEMAHKYSCTYILKTQSNFTLFSTECIYAHFDFKQINYCNGSPALKITCFNIINENEITHCQVNLLSSYQCFIKM